MIVCNNAQCQENILVQFLISFDDSVKLWKHKRIFKHASERDSYMRMKISNIISTGKYKHHSLKKEIEKASQEITQIFTYQDFYDNEKREKYYKVNSNNVDNNNLNNELKENKKDYDDLKNQQQYNDMFMTNLNGLDYNSNTSQNNRKSNKQQNISASNDELDQIDYIDSEIQKNFIQQNDLNSYKQKLSQGLVQNSTIFNKNFYSYITSQNNTQGLFDKQSSKIRVLRKPRLSKSSQIPIRKIQKLKEQEQQLMSLNFQNNNFMLSQENQNSQNYKVNY